MRILTSKQMKALEALADQNGLSYLRLMENAGCAAAVAIRSRISLPGVNCMVFCGAGNNGGDGFVVARKLREYGANVVVVLTDGLPRTEQAAQMFELLRSGGTAVFDIVEDNREISAYLKTADLIVDAIYGTGFHGTLDEKHAAIVEIINLAVAAVFSLDLPSGLSADQPGRTPAVQADFTIAFDCCKPVHCIEPGRSLCGEVEVVEIGIPKELHSQIQPTTFLVEESWVFSQLAPKSPYAHKGSNGKLLNLAGSLDYCGAALLSTEAALRCGAGYVTLASGAETCRSILPFVPHATALPLAANEAGRIAAENAAVILERAAGYDAVALGCGLGLDTDVCEWVEALVSSLDRPLLIDADGLNALSLHMDILRERRGETLLTPHPKELARLCGCTVQQALDDRVMIAQRLAQEQNCVVVVKGYQTLTVTPQGVIYINTTGNAGLAKAGSGDLLTGMAGALLAQGLDAARAAACAVWLHGAAADRCAARLSQYAMLGRDMLEDLARIFVEHHR